MTVFLATKKRTESQDSLGTVINEFLQALSSKVEWPKFKYFCTFIMMLFQFIINELNNSKIIYEAETDLLWDYINDFIQNGVEGLIQYYQV